MKSLDDIKHQLAASKALLQQSYHVSRLGLFGSYVRGEQTAESDVDVVDKLIPNSQ